MNSAALGAALIAAAADGQDLGALQEIFCKASPGTALQPDTALAPVYEAALGRFRSLLDQTLADLPQ